MDARLAGWAVQRDLMPQSTLPGVPTCARKAPSTMSMLAAVVNGLNNMGAMVAVAQDLARRRIEYGVQPAHYGEAGSALL
ncbi:hypothetical protein PEC18_36760 [Paucibacter sp. O1-1]|nr:hypothetical protein [Paucibacter sp. O1-1]MDA3831205.1 hypothetical protein [Paucibacter sp. O1-1]